MHRKAVKELLHVQGWHERLDEIAERGQEAYLADDLLQEAGDSLTMKLGEAANRLPKLRVLAPMASTRPSISPTGSSVLHQYDEINRDLTWLTLSGDLPDWKRSLASLFDRLEWP